MPYINETFFVYIFTICLLFSLFAIPIYAAEANACIMEIDFEKIRKQAMEQDKEMAESGKHYSNIYSILETQELENTENDSESSMTDADREKRYKLAETRAKAIVGEDYKPYSGPEDIKSSDPEYIKQQRDSLGMNYNPIKTVSLNLLFTVGIYSLPIIIYRFFIKKNALPKPKSRKIAITYGIFAFIVIIAVKIVIKDYTQPNINALFIWSIINYFILKSGKQKEKNSNIFE